MRSSCLSGVNALALKLMREPWRVSPAEARELVATIGLISRDELRDALADMGLELPEDEVLNMIHGTDMDKDGKLNFTEFQMLVGKFGGAAAASGGAAPEPAPAMGRTISGRAATTNEDSVSRIQRLRREAVNRGPNLDLNPRLKKPSFTFFNAK